MLNIYYTLAVVLVGGMKDKVLIFWFHVPRSFHPAELFHLSSLGCRTDFPKRCSGQSNASALSIGRAFPTIARQSAGQSRAVVHSGGQSLGVFRGTKITSECWERCGHGEHGRDCPYSLFTEVGFPEVTRDVMGKAN